MTTATTQGADAGTTTDTALRMEQLRVLTTAGTEIIHGVDLTLTRGEILGLVGESGSGKTTAGLACLGHYRAGLTYGSGRITLRPRDADDVDLMGLTQQQLRELRGSRVAYIPQDPALSLNPAIRVGAQIREVLDIHGYQVSGQSDDKARQERVTQVLEDVGLPGTAAYQHRWPHELSGGQQQRIGIAMAFAMTPDVLILDEPTTGLDVSTQSHVLDTVRHMTQSHDVASLYITHDLAVVAELADRVAVMLRGELIEEGPVQRILHQPEHPYTRRLLEAVPDLAGHKVMTATDELPTVTRTPGIRPEADQDGTDGGTEGDDALAASLTVSEPEAETTATDESVPLLAVSDLKKSYGATEVLKGLSFTLEPGQSTMVLGESGSGKTTLSRCVAGLIDDYKGTVALRGESLAASTRKRSNDQRQDVQYIFQSPFSSLNPRRTIGQSLTVPLEMSQRVQPAERRQVVEEALESVRLGRSFHDRRPGDLSGGERQRAAIARALVNAPSILVCDEITSALDVSVQASILALLNHLRAERGLALLFVTHNITLARHIADRIVVLEQGLIVDDGPVDEVLERPTHEYTKQLLSDVPTL